MVNRRAHRRTRVHRNVEIEPLETGRRSRRLFSSGGPQGPTPGKMLDIGCGGMSAECSGKLPVGTSCSVRIETTEGKVQRTRGTVRNVRSDSGSKTIGIAFTEPLLALGDPAEPGDSVAHDGAEPLGLVVDDDPGVRQLLERFLQGRGMRIKAVPSGEEALEVLRHEEQPCLMMLDLNMDGMTGVEMLETMGAEGLRVPNVWAMSGSVPDDEALAALTLGAAEFINKPFDLDHLDFNLQLLGPIL